MCVSVCVFVRVHADALGGQKRALDPLELELQLTVSHPAMVVGKGPLEEQSSKLGTTEPSPGSWLLFLRLVLIFKF